MKKIVLVSIIIVLLLINIIPIAAQEHKYDTNVEVKSCGCVAIKTQTDASVGYVNIYKETDEIGEGALISYNSTGHDDLKFCWGHGFDFYFSPFHYSYPDEIFYKKYFELKRDFYGLGLPGGRYYVIWTHLSYGTYGDIVLLTEPVYFDVPERNFSISVETQENGDVKIETDQRICSECGVQAKISKVTDKDKEFLVGWNIETNEHIKTISEKKIWWKEDPIKEFYDGSRKNELNNRKLYPGEYQVALFDYNGNRLSESVNFEITESKETPTINPTFTPTPESTATSTVTETHTDIPVETPSVLPTEIRTLDATGTFMPKVNQNTTGMIIITVLWILICIAALIIVVGVIVIVMRRKRK